MATETMGAIIHRNEVNSRKKTVMDLTAQGMRRAGVAVLIAAGVGVTLTIILSNYYRLDATAARDIFLIITGPLTVFVHVGMRVFAPLWRLIRSN